MLWPYDARLFLRIMNELGTDELQTHDGEITRWECENALGLLEIDE